MLNTNCNMVLPIVKVAGGGNIESHLLLEAVLTIVVFVISRLAVFQCRFGAPSIIAIMVLRY